MNKNKQEAIDKLIALIPEKERQFIKENKNSKDPEIRGKINDIYIKYGVIEEMFNPSGYLLSEENLLEWAKEGPEAKAAAQFFLGRMLDDEGYWDVPDYRYPNLELDRINKNPTYNDLRIMVSGWSSRKPDADNEVKFVGYGNNEGGTMKFLTKEEIVSISKDGVSINLTYNEIFSILQKCRELGMNEPAQSSAYKDDKKVNL